MLRSAKPPRKSARPRGRASLSQRAEKWPSPRPSPHLKVFMFHLVFDNSRRGPIQLRERVEYSESARKLLKQLTLRPRVQPPRPAPKAFGVKSEVLMRSSSQCPNLSAFLFFNFFGP